MTRKKHETKTKYICKSLITYLDIKERKNNLER